MTEEKQKLHERLLDSEDAILISCEKDTVSIDVMGDLINVGEGLAYALVQNIHLADFFMSVVAGTATVAADMGDVKRSRDIETSLQGILLYLREAKGKKQN